MIKLSDNDIAKMALEVVADECKRSLFYTVQTFWDVIIQEEPEYNWHIPYLCEELEKLAYFIIHRLTKPYDLIINIPPGTTKSTIVTIIFPVWLWILDPTIRIISNSYSNSLSIEHSSKSKDIINSDKFKKLFPHIKIRHDKSGVQHYKNTEGGSRYTTSTGSAVTGNHAHVIINDDPQNPKQAYSDALREQANEHTKTLSSRKVNKKNTPTITIMQRLHSDDVTGYLLKKKGEKIRHICMPAECSDNVKPIELKERYIDGLLDPQRLSKEVLDEAMIDLGSRNYAGQFGQTPTEEGGNIIKEDWFRKIPKYQFNALRGSAVTHFFIDTAYDEKKKKTDNDPSGIIAVCKVGNEIYIHNATKMYKTFPDLIRFVPEWANNNNYTKSSTLRIEPKANGKSVVQMLKQSTKLNVTETPTPTESKETRLNAASPKVECGRVYIVEDSWNEEFIDEVCGFPNKSHDEYVDLLGYAIDFLLEDKAKIPSNFSKASLGM